MEREKVFALALERFKSLSTKLQTPGFARFGQGPINNAVLLSLAVYHGHYPLFERALQQSGDSIPKLLRVLKTMASEEGNMLNAMKEWLEKGEARHLRDKTRMPPSEEQASP